MNTDTDRNSREEACPEIRLLNAKDALRLELRPIEVPENAELLLSPGNPEYANSFIRVRLKSYEDLQTLGFVPRKLAEDKVRQAMAADDAEMYDLAGKMFRQSPCECGCSKRTMDVSQSRGSPIRMIYNRMRKRHNPALSRVLSDHYGTKISWDTPVPAIVRKWVEFLLLRPEEIIIALLGDITIHRNATLAVAASSKSLLARNIWIHKTGRLVGQGSYLKVWANSINRFSDFLNPAAIAAAQKIAPLWTLTE